MSAVDLHTQRRWEQEDAAGKAMGFLGERETVEPLFGPNTIQTYSGAPYEFDNPDPAAVDLLDIAHALSNMCRFAGHTKRFYSVAEHSVFVSRILEEEGATRGWQKVGLLHDAHEAYVWDCPRPLKPLLGDAFEKLAEKADIAICQALHIAAPELFHAAAIKHADDVALVYEANELMHHGTAHWSQPYKEIGPIPPGLDLANLKPWSIGNGAVRGRLGKIPAQAKAAFLERCDELEVSL